MIQRQPSQLQRWAPVAVFSSFFISMFARPVSPDFSLLIGMPAVVWGLCFLKWSAKPLALFANFQFVALLLITANGAMSYMDSTGKLRRGGDHHHDYESFNLHRTHRCFVSCTGDCRPYAIQDLSDSFYNIGLVTCLKYFGPMEGHFLGSYPTKEETSQLLEKSAITVSRRDLVRRRCRFGFSDDVDFSLTEHSSTYERHHKHELTKIDKHSTVRFCSDGLQTIIIAVDDYAVLFDSQTGRSYARYHFSPDDQ